MPGVPAVGLGLIGAPCAPAKAWACKFCVDCCNSRTRCSCCWASCWAVGGDFFLLPVSTALVLLMNFSNLVGSWVVPIGLIIYFKWYKKLPAQERAEYDGKHKSNGDGFSFFAGLIWLAIVWFHGRWDVTFETWTLNDWVYSWLAAYLLLFLIIGIPGIIYVIYSLRKK